MKVFHRLYGVSVESSVQRDSIVRWSWQQYVDLGGTEAQGQHMTVHRGTITEALIACQADDDFDHTSVLLDEVPCLPCENMSLV